MKSLSFVICLLSLWPLLAAVPMKINFTGHLGGVSRGDGAQTVSIDQQVMYMVFRLYDRPGNGAIQDKGEPLWGRQASVSLQNGDFDVDLHDGFGSVVADARYATLAEAVDAALSRGSSVLYIGLTPENDSHGEIFPRMRVTAVPKAVQVASVRTVPDDFTVTGGTFRAERLFVEGSTSLRGATYADASFADDADVSFQGGFEVRGALKAGEIQASTVRAAAVVTDDFRPSSPLTVNGTLTAAGNPVLDGNLGRESAGPTVAVSVVRAKVSANTVGQIRCLKLNSFENNGSYLDQAEGGGRSILGPWVTVGNVHELQAGSRGVKMTCWDEQMGTTVYRMSVTDGLWMAPCDCLAYFQTRAVSASTQYGSCVQFYLGEGIMGYDLSTRRPDAVSSMRNGSATGASLDMAVPILLRKGQLVRWLGYNESGEHSYSYVESIVYRQFSW